MELTKRLYSSVEAIWQGYNTHPFVTGIADGTLDKEKFKFYMVQDYLYLLDYAKVFALGVVKARDEELMRFFAGLVHSTLDGEMTVHKEYMKRLGITKEDIKTGKQTLANTSYTNYMLWVGNNGGVLELIVSILACAWSYQLIGQEAAKHKGALEHEFYGEWAKSYSSQEYAKDTEEILKITDWLGRNINEEDYKRLEEIFINCSRYEYMFWDMAWKMEK